ncbi:hypothetical protein BN130_1521 [Cronobacter malonaticus 507]|nr:hypothetical protein BN130_1521 [Cronobacter malonaticus 507]
MMQPRNAGEARKRRKHLCRTALNGALAGRGRVKRQANTHQQSAELLAF